MKKSTESLTKSEIIEKLNDLFPRGWKTDLAGRIDYKRQAVSAWANKPDRKSRRIEKGARRMIAEGEKIREVQQQFSIQ